MNRQDIEAFAKEAAKSIKTPDDLRNMRISDVFQKA